MPEASVHENGHFQGRKDEVWSPWQAWEVKSVSKPLGPEQGPKAALRLGIAASNPGHLLRPGETHGSPLARSGANDPSLCRVGPGIGHFAFELRELVQEVGRNSSRKERWNRVANLLELLPKVAGELEGVGEGLKASRLPDRNRSSLRAVVVNVRIGVL
jgi:hypothetical protein